MYTAHILVSLCDNANVLAETGAQGAHEMVVLAANQLLGYSGAAVEPPIAPTANNRPAILASLLGAAAQLAEMAPRSDQAAGGAHARLIGAASALLRSVGGDANGAARPLTPVHADLDRAAAAGKIPKGLAGMLMVATDRTDSLARRSAAAYGASEQMARLEDAARPAEEHLGDVIAADRRIAAAEGALKKAEERVVECLKDIYEDPRAAWTELAKWCEVCGGPGRTAELIKETPTILCPRDRLLNDGIKGTTFFSPFFISPERVKAIATIPVLAEAVEKRGRISARLAIEKDTLRSLRAEPAQSAALAAELQARRAAGQEIDQTAAQFASLAEALQAHGALQVVCAAMGGSDPLSAVLLRQGANKAAAAATLADINSAPGIPASYRSMMADQAARRDNLAALQARQSDSAVGLFQAARAQITENGQAATRLQREGYIYPAELASKWSDLAKVEAIHAATTIMSDHNQHTLAARSGILRTVETFAQPAEVPTDVPEF